MENTARKAGDAWPGGGGGDPNPNRNVHAPSEYQMMNKWTVSYGLNLTCYLLLVDLEPPPKLQTRLQIYTKKWKCPNIQTNNLKMNNYIVCCYHMLYAIA